MCPRALCQSISFSGSVGHGKLVLFFLRLRSFRRLLRQRSAVSVGMEDVDALLQLLEGVDAKFCVDVPVCSDYDQRKDYLYFAFVALCGVRQTHFS